MLKRIDCVSKEGHLNAIKKFFELAEMDSYENQVTLEGRMKIEESPSTIKSFCIEICTEAINRDFVSYVSTGNKGIIGSDVYNALKS